MSEAPESQGRLRRTHSKSLAAPFLEFDLARELDVLQRESEFANGQNARTLVKYDDLRIVLIALKAEARIPEHAAGGRVSIHAMKGQIRVRAEGRTFRLPPGGLLTLDRGVLHDVEAVEDSAFLLTVAWAGRDASAPSPTANDD